MSHILFKVTTRTRPVQAYEVIKSIVTHASGNNHTILISVDEDDSTKDYLKSLLDRDGIPYVWCEGTSTSKINAINRDVPAEGWDILVNVSDDTHFIHGSFDKDIRIMFEKHFPDYDGVLHYPDGNRKDLLTMSIIGKKYYDRDGYIYHPDYISLWCDNEAMEVAQMRGKYVFRDVQIFEHRHWAYGKGHIDRQYQEQNGYFGRDKMVYESRKSRNFGL